MTPVKAHSSLSSSPSSASDSSHSHASKPANSTSLSADKDRDKPAGPPAPGTAPRKGLSVGTVKKTPRASALLGAAGSGGVAATPERKPGIIMLSAAEANLLSSK